MNFNLNSKSLERLRELINEYSEPTDYKTGPDGFGFFDFDGDVYRDFTLRSEYIDKKLNETFA